MKTAHSRPSDDTLPVQRTYGRAAMALPTEVETPFGRVRCVVKDLSLGGAQIEAEGRIEEGTSLWLALHKLKVFGTVRWTRDHLAGVQFDEKLPKAIILNLRGESVDPNELAAVETMLAARNWVIGNPVDRPISLRLVDVLGARNDYSDDATRLDVPWHEPSSSRSREKATPSRLNRSVLALILFSAVAGCLLGIGSVLVF